MCDILLDQLVALGFRVNPSKSAIPLQLHGDSAQKIREEISSKRKGSTYIKLGPLPRKHNLVSGLRSQNSATQIGSQQSVSKR